MFRNRGKKGYEVTNGPGKWTKAFNIPRAIDGATLNDCRLSIDTLRIDNILKILLLVHESVFQIKVIGHINLYVTQ